MRIRTSLAILLALSVVACGGGSATSSGGGEGETTSGQETAGELEGFDSEGFESTDPSVDHGTGSARELIGINPPPQPWDSMSESDQEMYMVSTVLPIHAEMFREYDAERYAAFECTTCHGDDAEAEHYEMPSRFLPPLPAEGTAAWTQAQARNPRAWTFMTDHVMPTIRTQIGESEMTCFTCHPHAGG